jgi:hypothetical protein
MGYGNFSRASGNYLKNRKRIINALFFKKNNHLEWFIKFLTFSIKKYDKTQTHALLSFYKEISTFILAQLKKTHNEHSITLLFSKLSASKFCFLFYTICKLINFINLSVLT